MPLSDAVSARHLAKPGQIERFLTVDPIEARYGVFPKGQSGNRLHTGRFGEDIQYYAKKAVHDYQNREKDRVRTPPPIQRF